MSNKKYNTYDLTGEYGIGYSTSGKEFYFDLDDYNLIKDICWNVKKDGYVCGWVNKDIGRVKMHIWIMGKIHIDHINKNPSDNRKCNLRFAEQSKNVINISTGSNNTSGIRGVNWNKVLNKWHARVRLNKKTVFSKYFINKEDAIVARLNAEQFYFGEFAPQRHLYEQYGVKESDEDI